MNTFVSVAKFRDLIDFAYDEINCHWHACVCESERVYWFCKAIERFNGLSKTDCKRAKTEDRSRYANVFDQFSNHTHKNFLIWLKARLELGVITQDQYNTIHMLYVPLAAQGIDRNL